MALLGLLCAHCEANHLTLIHVGSLAEAASYAQTAPPIGPYAMVIVPGVRRRRRGAGNGLNWDDARRLGRNWSNWFPECDVIYYAGVYPDAISWFGYYEWWLNWWVDPPVEVIKATKGARSQRLRDRFATAPRRDCELATGTSEARRSPISVASICDRTAGMAAVTSV
jgi:hypothetical protein